MLQLYNTLTRTKEPFEPLQPGHVKLYVCGITVYDQCHMGHARCMVCFDVIVRFLRACGYQVKFVRNITDVDDKIIARAAKLGISIQTLTEQSIQAMYRDIQALGVVLPDEEPRATESIESMIQLIQRLFDQGLAYVSHEGDVCFEVSKFKSYGKLSNQAVENLLVGARVEVDVTKRSPLDFVLWKRAKPGEPAWASPWGVGRPGWHIECSAMSMASLGESFDLHGGGIDLQFPHHENEIAQSEGATNRCFAKYWMHVGLLQINHEKMAKSAGNFLTIESILKHHAPEAVRYFLLSSHYRSVLNYSEGAFDQALKALTRLYQALKLGGNVEGVPFSQSWITRFHEAMEDDFNTPEALSVLFELSHELNKTNDPSLAATLKHLGGILGLLQQSPSHFLQTGKQPLEVAQIQKKIIEREAARQAKAFQQADAIRDFLLAQGVVLEDGPTGTTWRQAP